MLKLEELARRLEPATTSLVLGAGASIPSGAPSAIDLAERLTQALLGEPRLSDDFNEVCSILELKVGRQRLVDELRRCLLGLEPHGGILALPSFEWSTIYTTNYDCLIEESYKRAKKKLIVVRSNFDFGRGDHLDGTTYYKVHGCLTQDAVDGHKASMILTESDMRDYSAYRETLFRNLQQDMSVKDVLVVGNRLADPHLRRDVDEVLRLHRDSGAPGKLYVLSYDRDPDRAALLENRGVTVVFGDLDDLLYHVAADAESIEKPAIVYTSDSNALSRKLVPTITDAEHARTLLPDSAAVFNGRAATFADISAGLTFQRTGEVELIEAFTNGDTLIASIIGAGGVGKTTLARRVGDRLLSEGFRVWEHRQQFPLSADDWIAVEKRLSEDGQLGLLILDDCTEHLRQINLISEHLAECSVPALRLVVTAGVSQWRPRLKSPTFFSHGIVVELSRLLDPEIEALLNLAASNDSIRELVDNSFSMRSRNDQRDILRKKCSADMYVCLKNVFASEALDAIILREYAELPVEIQDVYRHVAALEASGAQVHRQMVLRLLGLESGTLTSLLEFMEGVIHEFDIDPSEGIFGWSTRHKVIAETLTQYKFADQQERYGWLLRVLSDLNPATYIERRAIRDLCDRDYGVGSLKDAAHRLNLYRKMIEIAPAERVPRHRLISELLRAGLIDSADQELREAEEAVGMDSPINRFKVRLAIDRASNTSGILEEDRRAMVLRAEEVALKGLEWYPKDKYAFRAYVDVGFAYAEQGGDNRIVDEAMNRMRVAAEVILDPDMAEWLRRYERDRLRLDRR